MIELHKDVEFFEPKIVNKQIFFYIFILYIYNFTIYIEYNGEPREKYPASDWGERDPLREIPYQRGEKKARGNKKKRRG